MRMMYCCIVNISDIKSIREIEELLYKISESRKLKINQYKFQSDKIRSVLAETILRYALYKSFKIYENIIFDCNFYGKPYLSSNKQISFNLSHSGEWVVCGVSDSSSIGIDVEKISCNIIDFAKRSYSEEEYNYIINQPDNMHSELICKIWTLKESYVKYLGTGFNIPIKSFSFELLKESIVFYVNGYKNNTLSFFTNKLDSTHYMSLCVEKKQEIIQKTEEITVNKLIEWNRQF